MFGIIMLINQPISLFRIKPW